MIIPQECQHSFDSAQFDPNCNLTRVSQPYPHLSKVFDRPLNYNTLRTPKALASQTYIHSDLFSSFAKTTTFISKKQYHHASQTQFHAHSLVVACLWPAFLEKKLHSLEFCYWSTQMPPHEVVYCATKKMMIKLTAPWSSFATQMFHKDYCYHPTAGIDEHLGLEKWFISIWTLLTKFPNSKLVITHLHGNNRHNSFVKSKNKFFYNHTSYQQLKICKVLPL